MKEAVVIILEAEPSGFSTFICLDQISFLNIIVEREGCPVDLWKGRCYERLCLHNAKEFFCEVLHYSRTHSTINFIFEMDFKKYINDYSIHF
ncbi:hypothetical protein AMTRI_Chr11g156720 [Amborella trichopoda]